MFIKLSMFAALLTSTLLIPAYAADLASRKSSNTGTVSTVSNWTGVYGGVNGGYSFNGSIPFTNTDGSPPGRIIKGMSGGEIGLRFGIDFQFREIVFGFLANRSWSKLGGSFPGEGLLRVSQKSPADLAVRIGYSMDPKLLIYMLSGQTRTKTEFKSFDDTIIPTRIDKTVIGKQGLMIGIGVERRIAEHVSGYAEYSEHRFQKKTSPDGCCVLSENWRTVRLGLNYRF